MTAPLEGRELHAARLAALAEVCLEVGWPAPGPKQGMWSWVDASIPRSVQEGGPLWQQVHAELRAAVEALHRDDLAGVRVRLRRAKGLVVIPEAVPALSETPLQAP